MGCWNATCHISNLPIYAGDKIVVIPLRKTREAAVYNCCYPTDNFQPLCFPIFGEYDDYGGIENCYTINENLVLLEKMKFFYKDRDGHMEEFHHYEKLDDFASHILCCPENAYIKEENNNNFPSGFAEINFMMVHFDLYMAMINEMGERIPYGKDENYMSFLLSHFEEIVDTCHKEITTIADMMYEVKDNEKASALARQCTDISLQKIADNIFGYGVWLFSNKQWTSVARLLVFGNDIVKKRILREAMNAALFNSALSASRKGYLCVSGCGSQSEETKMQHLIATFAINHIKHITDKRNQDGNPYPEYGMKESLFV